MAPLSPPLPPLLPEPPPLLLPLPVLVGGAVGVKVADGFSRQELAAALASATFDGAFSLIVALPEKSHEVATRFESS